MLKKSCLLSCPLSNLFIVNVFVELYKAIFFFIQIFALSLHYLCKRYEYFLLKCVHFSVKAN